MLLIITSAMGVMNVIPWGGPTLRAATNIGMDANLLCTILYLFRL